MGFASTAFKLATAPALFALKQTVTSYELWQEWREDYAAYEPILQKATERTLENMIAVLAAAEQSLPSDIAALTPREREEAIKASLARGEKHLLVALGEIYRSYRLLTADNDYQDLIENPPQSEIE